MHRLDQWLAARNLGDAEILAIVPNTSMDRLDRADRARLSGLLEQEHTYRQHPGNPVAEWNAARTRDQITRLLDPT